MKLSEFKKRVYKKARIKISLITVLILASIFPFIIILSLVIKDLTKFIYFFGTIFLIILMMGIYKMFYYSFLYKANLSERTIILKKTPYKFKLKPYFDNFGPGKYGTIYFGIMVFFRVAKNKKVRVFYPFYSYDLFISSKRWYEKKKEIQLRLAIINEIEIKYLEKSKIIIESSIDIEKIIAKLIGN